MSEDLRNMSDEILKSYSLHWEKGLQACEEDYEIRLTKKLFNIHINLRFKHAPIIERKIILSPKEKSLKRMEWVLPKTTELSDTQLEQFNAIVSKLSPLYLIEPMNSRVKKVVPSKGYESFLALFKKDEMFGERTMETRYVKPFGVIYFFESFWTTFAIWVDLDKKQFISANWLDTPMQTRGIIDKQLFDFLDSSLKKNGDFGVYGNVQSGLAFLVDHYDIGLNYRENEAKWWMSVTPLDGHGHYLHFDIDAKSGAIGAPIAGHMVPPPPVTDAGLDLNLTDPLQLDDSKQ